jgi:pyridoxamine 5'-phosphate oxidase family protein
MSVFSDAQLDYLRSQRLRRLATAGHDGVSHVVPVAFRYNPDTDSIDIGGYDFAKRKKFRDVKRTGMATLVVDDVLPPCQPRAVEVRGQAITLDCGGKAINEGLTTRLSGSRLAGSCPGASRTASRLGRSVDPALTTRSVDRAASVSDLGTSLLTWPGNARWCASLTCVERRCQPEFGQAALTCHGDQMTLQSSPRLRARRDAACRSMLGPPGGDVLPIGSTR